MKQKIHEIFSYPFERGKINKEFLVNYLKDIDNIGLMSYLFKYFPYKLLYKYIGKDIDYVFLGTKNLALARTLLPHKSIFLTSIRDIGLIERKKNLFVFPIHYIIYGVSKIFSTDPLLEKRSSEKIINFTVDFFKLIQPKFLIVPNDSLFVERFLIYCAKEAGIKTISIQHGLFQSISNPIIFDGKYTDFMYVWSEKQKNILIEGGLSPYKIFILGYTNQLLNLKSHFGYYNKTKICILGQPYERYDKKLGEKKKQIFNEIISEFEDVQIAYKPHPGEKDSNCFPDGVVVFSGTLHEAIEEYDYFFSLTSTALLEVSLGGKIAIQLYDVDFNCDIFEEVGWSYTYNLINNIDLRQYIDEINESFVIGKDTLFFSENIGERFLELEKTIQH